MALVGSENQSMGIDRVRVRHLDPLYLISIREVLKTAPCSDTGASELELTPARTQRLNVPIRFRLGLPLGFLAIHTGRSVEFVSARFRLRQFVSTESPRSLKACFQTENRYDRG